MNIASTVDAIFIVLTECLTLCELKGVLNELQLTQNRLQ
jgi:hypothetical protein